MFNSKSKTICFIPARKGSNRIQNKNLKKINNISLTEITIKQAKKAKIFSEIILSSDSNKILNIGKKHKINCYKRSKKNSRNTSSTDEALKETLKKTKKKYKNIIILQVTSPLRKTNTIKKFTKFCLKKKLNHCLTVSKFDENLSLFKKNYFTPINKIRQRSQLRKKYLYENGLIYFITKEFFFKKFKIFPKKNWNYFLTDKYESIDINDKNDYEICKNLYKNI